MLPPITSTCGKFCLTQRRASIDHALRMAVRGIDDDDVDTGLDQQRTRSSVPSPAHGRAHPQAARRPWRREISVCLGCP